MHWKFGNFQKDFLWCCIWIHGNEKYKISGSDADFLSLLKPSREEKSFSIMLILKYFCAFLFHYFVQSKEIEFSTCDANLQVSWFRKGAKQHKKFLKIKLIIQREITEIGDYACEPRPTVVDLKPRIANLSDVIDIVPDFTMVARCGGNCALKEHK